MIPNHEADAPEFIASARICLPFLATTQQNIATEVDWIVDHDDGSSIVGLGAVTPPGERQAAFELVANSLLTRLAELVELEEISACKTRIVELRISLYPFGKSQAGLVISAATIGRLEAMNGQIAIDAFG